MIIIFMQGEPDQKFNEVLKSKLIIPEEIEKDPISIKFCKYFRERIENTDIEKLSKISAFCKKHNIENKEEYFERLAKFFYKFNQEFKIEESFFDQDNEGSIELFFVTLDLLAEKHENNPALVNPDWDEVSLINTLISIESIGRDFYEKRNIPEYTRLPAYKSENVYEIDSKEYKEETKNIDSEATSKLRELIIERGYIQEFATELGIAIGQVKPFEIFVLQKGINESEDEGHTLRASVSITNFTSGKILKIQYESYERILLNSKILEEEKSIEEKEELVKREIENVEEFVKTLSEISQMKSENRERKENFMKGFSTLKHEFFHTQRSLNFTPERSGCFDEMAAEIFGNEDIGTEGWETYTVLKTLFWLLSICGNVNLIESVENLVANKISMRELYISLGNEFGFQTLHRICGLKPKYLTLDMIDYIFEKTHIDEVKSVQRIQEIPLEVCFHLNTMMIAIEQTSKDKISKGFRNFLPKLVIQAIETRSKLYLESLTKV